MRRVVTSHTGRTALVLLAILVLASPLAAARQSSADRVRIQAHMSVDGLYPGEEARAALLLKITPGWHINSGDPGVEGLIATSVRMADLPAGLSVSQWELPDGESRTFAFSPEPLSVYEGKVIVRATVRAAADLAPGDYVLKGSLRVQACNDRLCLRPGNREFELAVRVVPEGTAVAALKPDLFEGDEPSALPEAGSAAAVKEQPQGWMAGVIEKYGLVLAFGILFLTGLGLCLTPCVFPMIPITAGFFANQASGSRTKALLLAIVYVQGLALVYAVLGAVAGVTGAMLGSALQSPWVMLGFALVMVALSLSMFGLYEFRIPGLESAGRGRTGYVGALIMGAILGVVAAPCVGPASAALLSYVGQRQDPIFGFFAFLVLAEGLGFPFLILAYFTDVSLPRAGEWMVWVKKVFGVLILGLAIWFLTLTPWIAKEARPWIYLAWAVAGGVYLGFLERSGRQSPRFRVVKAATGIVMVVLALLGVWATRPKASDLQWKPLSVAAMDADLAAGQPVVLDFYADWCIPCFELDHRTFSDPRVASILEEFSRYKGDMTTGTEETHAWEERFDISGVPTVLFFDSAGRERVRIIEFMDADALLELLEKETFVSTTGLEILPLEDSAL